VAEEHVVDDQLVSVAVFGGDVGGVEIGETVMAELWGRYSERWKSVLVGGWS
jgi:hypothetical protein